MLVAPYLQVVSGDTVVVQGLSKAGSIPPEKRITLSSLIAPKLVSTAYPDCLGLREQITLRCSCMPSLPECDKLRLYQQCWCRSLALRCQATQFPHRQATSARCHSQLPTVSGGARAGAARRYGSQGSSPACQAGQSTQSREAGVSQTSGKGVQGRPVLMSHLAGPHLSSWEC